MADPDPIEFARGRSFNVSLTYRSSRATVTTNGAASAGDDSITIKALDYYIASGTTIVFTSGATFTLSQAAEKGATTLNASGDSNDLSGNIADGETAVVPSKNFYTSDAQFTAKLVIRRKTRSCSVSGRIIDTLTSNTSGSAQNTTGRIRFPNVGTTSTLPNIQLYWSGAESSEWPNQEDTVYGDLQITDTDVASTEVIHSFRLVFDIKPEII